MSSGYSVLFCRQPTLLGQNSLRLREAACWPCTPPRSIWCWGRGRGWIGVGRGVGGRDGVGAAGWSWSWWLGLRRGVKVGGGDRGLGPGLGMVISVRLGRSQWLRARAPAEGTV
eukprot:scaffold84179_cov56-Phaeocystis_antarctica.AAC.1